MHELEKECLIDNFKILCNIERNLMYLDFDFSLSSCIEVENEINEASKQIRELKEKIKIKVKEYKESHS